MIVDAVDGKGEFINFLDSQIGVVAPNRERTVIDLEQVGPGRYRGRFPAPRRGSIWWAWPSGEAIAWWARSSPGLVVPYAQELRDLGVDDTFLREVTELTGGGAVDDPGTCS